MDILSELYFTRLIGLIGFVTVAAAIIFYFSQNKEERNPNPFKNADKFLNGECEYTSSIFGGSFKGRHEGFSYTIKYDSKFFGNEYGPTLWIFFERPTPFNMIVLPSFQPRPAFTRKKIVKTGNPEFDNGFTVYADDVLHASNYVRTSDVLVYISALFLLGYEELHVAKNMVRAGTAVDVDKDLAIYLDKTKLTETIKSLAFLAKSLS